MRQSRNGRLPSCLAACAGVTFSSLSLSSQSWRSILLAAPLSKHAWGLQVSGNGAGRQVESDLLKLAEEIDGGLARLIVLGNLKAGDEDRPGHPAAC